MGAIRGDLERDPGTLDSANLSAFAEQRSDKGWEPSATAPENEGKCFRLALVGALVDKKTEATFGLPGPEIAFPSAHPDEAEAIEIDVAVIATLDVPEKNRLAITLIRRLSECTRACDGAATVVKPVARNLPRRNVGHLEFRSCATNPSQ